VGEPRAYKVLGDLPCLSLGRRKLLEHLLGCEIAAKGGTPRRAHVLDHRIELILMTRLQRDHDAYGLAWRERAEPCCALGGMRPRMSSNPIRFPRQRDLTRREPVA
jgi:hypothetical protein